MNVASAFFLRWLETRGAAVEQGPDAALVLVPQDLREVLRVPEILAVTVDPDVAAEDGALLLTPGHPALERGVSEVLEQGDAGIVWLPWPRPLPPTPETLLSRAREAVAVDHGRIDAERAPQPVFAPLLRIEALCTHTVDDQFQERVEVWVDGRSGRELPAAHIRMLRTAGGLHGEPARHPILLPRLDLALSAADALLQTKVEERSRSLGMQGAVTAKAERARTTAYYEELLDSLARRQQGAPAERQALLARQAEVAQAEAQRRLREIEEKYRPSHTLRPVRLHLMLTPALQLPLWVRRGDRLYPFALCWSLYGGAFLPVSCPRCGSDAPLVAGRSEFGCRACLGPTRAETSSG